MSGMHRIAPVVARIGALLGLALIVAMPAHASLSRAIAVPQTGRASVSSTGVEGDASSGGLCCHLDLSADGRYVVFPSYAGNLVAGDGNHVADIFRRDLVSGTTERVSVSTSGAEGNGGSGPIALGPQGGTAVSADGQRVVFTSEASNLVAGDVNDAQDVFVRDLSTGTTQQVSVASDGTRGNHQSGNEVAISANGRHVAFVSFATNLVPGDTNSVVDVFVRDLELQTTERVSVSSAGAQQVDPPCGNAIGQPSISGDGRLVAFDSCASNLVPGDDNLTTDAFLRDRVSGTTERVSIDSRRGGRSPMLSDDGRYLLQSTGPGLVLKDRATGALTLVPLGGALKLSRDGRYVAVVASGPLADDDSNGGQDAYIYDRVARTVQRVSRTSHGAQMSPGLITDVAISPEGGVAAFATSVGDLVDGDTNGVSDIFVHGLDPRETSPLPSSPYSTLRCGTVRPFHHDAEAQSDPAAPRVQAFVATGGGNQPRIRTMEEMANKLQDTARYAYDQVLAASGRRKAIRFRTGGSGCSSVDDIDVVEIKLSPGVTTPGQAWDDIRRQVRGVPMTLWLGVLADVSELGRGGGAALSQGAPPTPAQDVGLDDGAVAQGGAGLDSQGMLHELFHAFGAVNDNAPHSDGNDHLTVGDLMDPEGGGPIDPAHIHYFNPNGAIVGRDGRPIWNTYDSLFLCAPATCFGSVTRPQIQVQRTGSTLQATGATYFRWYVNGGPQLSAGSSAFTAPPGSTVTVRGINADGGLSQPLTVRIPADALPTTTDVWTSPVTVSPGGTTPGTSGATSAPSAAETCEDVYVISARGSGQPWRGATNADVSPETKRVYAGIQATLPAGKTVGFHQLGPTYRALSTDVLGRGMATALSEGSPASRLKAARSRLSHNLDEYLGGADKGVSELNAYLTHLTFLCFPQHKEPSIILVGYSQGAMIIHEQLRRLARAHSTMADRIKAVVLVADPARVARSRAIELGDAAAKNHGACHILDDLPGDRACFPPNKTADIPASFANRTWSVCLDGDVVCDTSSLFAIQSVSTFKASLKAGTFAHSTLYESTRLARDAGKAAGRRVK